MWRKNETLDLSGTIYRILEIWDSELVWIDVFNPRAIPLLVHNLNLEHLIRNGELKRVDDPFKDKLKKNVKFESLSYQKRDKALKVIQAVIKDEQCFNPSIRCKRILELQAAGISSQATTYRYLRRYWQRGQMPNALIPDYENCGNPGMSRSGKGTKKPGPKRTFSSGTGVKITPDIERLFRTSIERYLLKPNHISIGACYRRFRDLYHDVNPNETPNNYPTERQFKYFYNKAYPIPNRIERQTDAGTMNKDVRALFSTATSHVVGPGSRYEIDATIADIYVVDESDESRILGRPTIYVIVDVFSRMVAGLYIGFESPSYVIAMQTLAAACVDKVELCKKYGIEIESSDWPCIGIPDVVLADRGELMSTQADYCVNSLNIRFEAAPPRRGDAKGIVERKFRTIQADFKTYASGVVAGSKIKKHGEDDYRTTAQVTMYDLTATIIETIVFYNQHKVMDRYDRDPDMPSDIPSIPLHIWKWGIENRTGGLRNTDEETLRVAMLPRKKAMISQNGIQIWGLYYTCAEVIEQGWFLRHKKTKRPSSLQAAYDPNQADTIYLFPTDSTLEYWTCNLTDRSREFRGLTLWEVWTRQSDQRRTNYSYKEVEQEKRIEFEKKTNKRLVSKGKNKFEKSDRQRISEIKNNKKDALANERKSKVKPNQRTKDKSVAQIIPLAGGNEDMNYSAPPSLLFDEDDED